jgi:hypothetical protein
MSKLIQYRGVVYREAMFGRTSINPDRFVHDLIVPDKLAAADFRNEDVDAPEPLTWSLDEHNFLNSYIVHVDTSRSPPRTLYAHPKYIAWYPMSGELLFSPSWYTHDYLLHYVGDNHLFDDWVRAYIPSSGFAQNTIVVHFWRPAELINYTGDDVDDLFKSGPRALGELLKPLAAAVGLTVKVEDTPTSIVDRYTKRK